MSSEYGDFDLIHRMNCLRCGLPILQWRRLREGWRQFRLCAECACLRWAKEGNTVRVRIGRRRPHALL